MREEEWEKFIDEIGTDKNIISRIRIVKKLIDHSSCKMDQGINFILFFSPKSNNSLRVAIESPRACILLQTVWCIFYSNGNNIFYDLFFPILILLGKFCQVFVDDLNWFKYFQLFHLILLLDKNKKIMTLWKRKHFQTKLKPKGNFKNIWRRFNYLLTYKNKIKTFWKYKNFLARFFISF